MFKDVDKSMLMKLVALHVVVITVSNALVAIPVEIFGVKLTWAAFTFPLVVIATDLTVRLLGKTIARQTIAAAYPLAIIGSIAVVLAEGAPGSVALRIGFASATAYAIGTLLDVYVFQYILDNFGKQDQRIKFAALINNKPSKVKLDYHGYEINKEEAPAWIVFPWEEWDK